MKLENIAKRIIIAREAKTKYVLPFDNFIDRIISVAELVDFVEDENATKEIKQEARKYLVIACASAMETYFKRIAQRFIDAKWVEEELRDILKQDKISLADLFEINKSEFSLGELISVSHSFQDLESVNHFYSKMLGVVDFIKEFEAVEVETEQKRRFILKNDYPDFRKKIAEILHLRHLIVHHEGYKGILGLQRVQDMMVSMIATVSAADSYIMQRVPED